MAFDHAKTSATNTRFRDISLSFEPNPLTGDLLVRNDIDAIKDSVRNLILLGRGEKPFKPSIGGNAYAILFDTYTVATKTVAEARISNSLAQYEPRIKDVAIMIARPSPNTLDIRVQFLVVGTTEIQTLKVSVDRTR